MKYFFKIFIALVFTYIVGIAIIRYTNLFTPSTHDDTQETTYEHTTSSSLLSGTTEHTKQPVSDHGYINNDDLLSIQSGTMAIIDYLPESDMLSFLDQRITLTLPPSRRIKQRSYDQDYDLPPSSYDRLRILIDMDDKPTIKLDQLPLDTLRCDRLTSEQPDYIHLEDTFDDISITTLYKEIQRHDPHHAVSSGNASHWTAIQCFELEDHYYELTINRVDTQDELLSIVDSLMVSSTASQPDILHYTNETYNFSIELPANWSGYKIFTNTGTGIVESIQIGLSTSAPWPDHLSGRNDDHTEQIIYAPVVAITVREQDHYLEILSECDEPIAIYCLLGHELGHNDRYYFTFGGPNAWPDDRDTRYPNRNTEQGAGRITKTFKIL